MSGAEISRESDVLNSSQSFRPDCELKFPHNSGPDRPIDLAQICAFCETIHALGAPLVDQGKLVICGFGEAPASAGNGSSNAAARKLRTEIRHVHIGHIDKTVE